MLVGVANKLDQYGDDDIRQLTLLMNGVWNIIQRKRSDEALLRSNEELSAAYEQITAAEEELRAQYEIISATMKEKQKQEEQHRFILENIPDPVVILTFEGMVLYANPAAYAIVEMNPDAALFPLNISELLATESVHKAMNDLAEIEQKHRVVAEYILLTKSGGLRVVEAAGVVIQWKGQDAVLVSLRDITGREEDKDALMQANRKLAILSSITRHDILNQVAALLGYLEMMHDQDLIEETQRYIEKCLACTKTIQSQIAFTKLVDDIRNKSLSWQYTEHMVTRVLRNIAMGAITCHMHVCGLYLYADPIFEKVIYALVENSLRHGEHVSSMVFSYQIDGEECIFVFEDNGIGIPDDEKEKIFRQGYGKNTGLGLFLIREILAINEMSIKETGTYGTGARFEITVPGGKWMVNEAKP
jgi:PAS domain S-box-containing protein